MVKGCQAYSRPTHFFLFAVTFYLLCTVSTLSSTEPGLPHSTALTTPLSSYPASATQSWPGRSPVPTPHCPYTALFSVCPNIIQIKPFDPDERESDPGRTALSRATRQDGARRLIDFRSAVALYLLPFLTIISSTPLHPHHRRSSATPQRKAAMMTPSSGGASSPPIAPTMRSDSVPPTSPTAQPVSLTSSTLASTLSDGAPSTTATPSPRATSPTLSERSDFTARLSTASEDSDATTMQGLSSASSSASSDDSVSTEELYIQAELLRNLHLELDDEQQLRAPSRPYRSTTSGGPAPLHRPQAYPPLSALTKVKLCNDPNIVAMERARGETQASCYALPFKDSNGKQALAVIPGAFLPGFLNSEEASPKPAIITQSVRLGQLAVWQGKGWARLQSLAGHGTDLRPTPTWSPPRMTEAEAMEPGFSLQLHTMTYVPEWATEYPFALLYHPATGFAFPLLDFEDLEEEGKATFPYANDYKARYVGLIFCPFDPFDLRHDSPEAQDGHKHAGEHPWRTSKRIFSRA